MFYLNRLAGRILLIILLIIVLAVWFGCSHRKDVADTEGVDASSKQQQEPALTHLATHVETGDTGLIDPNLTDPSHVRSTAKKAAKEVTDANLSEPNLVDPNRAHDAKKRAIERLVRGMLAQAEAQGTELPRSADANSRGRPMTAPAPRLWLPDGQIDTNEPIQQLYAEWSRKETIEEKTEFLETLSSLADEQQASIFPILEQALDDASSDVTAAAVELLASYTSGEVLPLLEKALASTDEDVRFKALDVLQEIQEPAVVEVFSKALSDTSKPFRQEVIARIEDMEGLVQIDILARSITSGFPDVKTEALMILETRGDHAVVSVIIEGLKDHDAEYRAKVNSALSFLVNQDFSSYQDAANWWRHNQGRFDENLIER